MEVDWGALATKVLDGATIWGPILVVNVPIAVRAWHSLGASVFGADMELVRRSAANGAALAVKQNLSGEQAISFIQTYMMAPGGYATIIKKRSLAENGRLDRIIKLALLREEQTVTAAPLAPVQASAGTQP